MIPTIVLLPVAEKWNVAAVVTLGAWLNVSPHDKVSFGSSVSSKTPPVEDVPLNCDWNELVLPTVAVHKMFAVHAWALSQIVIEFEIALVTPSL
jgi:hypothetical protein